LCCRVQYDMGCSEGTKVFLDQGGLEELGLAFPPWPPVTWG